MNIIIVGCGKIGEKLAEKLSLEKEHDITVIDTRYRVVQDIANKYDLMGVVGSGASTATLHEAGVENADLLIAVTGSDELNLLVCLIARKTGGNCKTIARVRKPEYSKDLNLFKEDLGLAMIINPEQTAAAEIARVLRFPTAIAIDTFAKGRVEILKFRIRQGSPLADMRISDMSKKLSCDVLVCGAERGDDAIIPSGDFTVKEGDLLSVVASPKNAAYFFKKIGVKTNKVKDTIIVGGGSTSYYLASQLLQSGIDVKIIEQNPERCERLCQLLPKATIINGDGTDTGLLLEEGLERCESFVSLTNIDEENVLLSLYAKSITNAKVITKVNRIAYDNVIDSLNLDSVIYPKNITAEYIVRFVRAKNNSMGSSNIETMHMIFGGKAEALEFRIHESSEITDKPLQELNIKSNILITCINRNGKIIIPRGQDTIQTGDTVIVITTVTGLNNISDILG